MYGILDSSLTTAVSSCDDNDPSGAVMHETSILSIKNARSLGLWLFNLSP